jgi:hypothetical protein
MEEGSNDHKKSSQSHENKSHINLTCFVTAIFCLSSPALFAGYFPGGRLARTLLLTSALVRAFQGVHRRLAIAPIRGVFLRGQKANDRCGQWNQRLFLGTGENVGALRK